MVSHSTFPLLPKCLIPFSLLEEHSGQISELEKELGDCRRQISEQQKEIGILQQELDDQKDANSKAPTTTMKNLVERLRNQLALKEKQHKVIELITHLKHALSSLSR